MLVPCGLVLLTFDAALQGVLQVQPGVMVHTAPESPSEQQAPEMQPVYIWTQDTVYECAMDMRPEEIFKRLVIGGLERNHAEPLGKTLGLDLLGLYHTMADEYFEAGDHERALSIYLLSNVDPGALAHKWIQVGRMDVAIAQLRAALHKEKELPPKTQEHLSRLLLVAHLYLVMDGTAHNLEDIQRETDKLCSAGSGHQLETMEVLQSAGLFQELVLLGNAHGTISDVLDITARSGHSQVPASWVQQLVQGGHGQLLLRHAVFVQLARTQQVQILLHCLFQDSVRVVPMLYEILPHLDQAGIIEVARAVDPHGPSAAPLAALSGPDAGLEMGSEEMGSEEMGYLLTEVYLAAFLHIHAYEASSPALEVATSLN
jgi:hypothetical protein